MVDIVAAYLHIVMRFVGVLYIAAGSGVASSCTEI